ncbi:cytochrome P450 monooxygenase-like protein [Amylocarpus encephaloides]|uniref:Cytochrome P450 monooxygenase-like protein n=1 Tax=Amylocarpus encephaloides TaxID=45428 RepID=A0A9P7YKZ6_9HELO|nr:cytochrome P450 monooxygenase-like protein [Amylocarpus encephaloides]
MAKLPGLKLGLPNPELILTSVNLVIATTVILCGIAVFRIWLHPLAAFPGPKIWAVSRLPWIRYMLRGRMWRKIERLHQEYGTVVRIAPAELSFNSPAAWTDIYISKPLMPKEPSSQTPPLNGAHSLFTAVGDDHRRLRGILANGFSDKALREQAPIIDNHATGLISRLRREIKSASPIVDIQKFLGYAALDTISDLSYGESMEGLPERNEHGWIARFFLHGRFSTVRMCLCAFSPLDKVLDFFVLSLTRRQRTKNWAVFSAKIERRLAKGDMTGQRSDLISPVVGKVTPDHEIDASAKMKAKGITSSELLSHTLASIVANSQLTTVALTTTIYLLLRNPKTLKSLTAEIRHFFTQDSQINVHSTNSLKYLDAVVNESMRLRHPTPISLPRVVPPSGRVIDGTFIPGNTIVGVNLHVISTSPLYWVEGHEFHPERFLKPEDERYEKRFEKDVKAAYMPFSTGPRNCIGGNFIVLWTNSPPSSRLFLAETRVTLAKLLWNFELVLEDPVDEWLDRAAYIVYEPTALKVKLIDQQNGEVVKERENVGE